MAQAQPVNNNRSIQEQRQHADFAQFKDMQKRIGDFTSAKLIVDFLDQNSSMRHSHMGVYLRARETVQRYRVRCAKLYRFGFAVGCVTRFIGKGFSLVGKAIRMMSSKFLATIPRPAAATPSVPSEPSILDEPQIVWPTLIDPIESNLDRSMQSQQAEKASAILDVPSNSRNSHLKLVVSRRDIGTRRSIA